MDTKVIKKKRGIVKRTENAGNEEINHFILTELSVGQTTPGTMVRTDPMVS